MFHFKRVRVRVLERRGGEEEKKKEIKEFPSKIVVEIVGGDPYQGM